ncbi:MAG: spore cortex biosynthesis protein YabQ [Oscillospiraceae bacterium]|nr:spore cortex biosynthesis protein YabQ [Oscillospiraceae bacterium]
MVFNPGSFTGVTNELKLFGLAIIVGAVLGAVYDILRALRITIPHKFWAVFAEDFLFVIFSGFVWFCFSVELLEGELRLYVLVGMLAGFAVYLLTLGRIISGAFRFLTNILRKCENYVLGKLKNALPAKKFFGKIKKSS